MRIPMPVLVSTALLASCAPSGGAEADAGPEPSVTMVGDTAFLDLPLGRSADNGEITVRFEAVTEDSRCPIGVQCVWEGNAGIRLTLEGGDEPEGVVLGSAIEPLGVVYAGYVIELRDLTPHPVQDEPHDPDAYVVRLAVVATP